MSNKADVLMLVGVLPVIADIIEDNYGTTFRFNVKKKATQLVDEIRKMDETIMDGAEINVVEEQHRIALSFRQWYKDHFKENKQNEIN
jgi:hypothetical protein